MKTLLRRLGLWPAEPEADLSAQLCMVPLMVFRKVAVARPDLIERFDHALNQNGPEELVVLLDTHFPLQKNVLWGMVPVLSVPALLDEAIRNANRR